jgi:hypothetical protein
LPFFPVAFLRRDKEEQWWSMPLGRYLTFVGSMLLALLFLADWYFPKSSGEPVHADVDRSIIRIHSRNKWPEAIVFDTSQPTIKFAPVITADSPSRSSRDAMAMVRPEPPSGASIAIAKPKPLARKSSPKTARLPARQIASYPAAYPAGW